MTTAPDPLDRRARQLHAESLAHLSPEVLARLRRARHAAAATATATPRRRYGLMPWLAGGSVAAALALAVLLRPGLLTGVPGADTAASAATTVAYDAPVEPLQEDPGFYLWLGSVEATALAME